MSGALGRRVGAVMVVGLLATGCGTSARWVNCDGRLEPINVPAPRPANEASPDNAAKPKQAAP